MVGPDRGPSVGAAVGDHGDGLTVMASRVRKQGGGMEDHQRRPRQGQGPVDRVHDAPVAAAAVRSRARQSVTSQPKVTVSPGRIPP